MSDQGRAVAFECSKRLIERAAATVRLRNEIPTIELLKQTNQLEGVVNFPGQCWRLDGGVASLEPCTP